MSMTQEEEITLKLRLLESYFLVELVLVPGLSHSQP
jgi:hypothetical protein